ncbi:MAG TPA: FAD:protein FMN transferase [Planctomycetota bacterium]|nr:FAD:protein FMN transferase [Planctomycetota bacterium]HRR80458.1 FAD:protein FMN transferase [Planctomycetota bacterium]
MRTTLTHDAMATTFRMVIADEEAAYARQAAAEAFAELDRVEARLSRFAEGSDIWRINRLRVGEATFVHHDTLECIRIAEQVRCDTADAFDIAYAGRSEGVTPRGRARSRKHPACGPTTGGAFVATPMRSGAAPPLIEFDGEAHTVRVLAEGVHLDLGGIGKGFALDRMATLLREWGIGSALLCASTSTLLALDAPSDEEGWAAELGPGDAPQRLVLANQALGASGLGVKGSHIIDPRTGRPAEGRLRAWAIAPSAAVADALSTAFMVMGDEEIRSCCRRSGASARLLCPPTGICTTIP